MTSSVFLRPAAYVVNVVDLRPIQPENELVKYPDDTYLVIPAINNHASEEVQHVQEWAEENNLRLNPNKCKEIIFQSSRAKARK